MSDADESHDARTAAIARARRTVRPSAHDVAAHSPQRRQRGDVAAAQTPAVRR